MKILLEKKMNEGVFYLNYGSLLDADTDVIVNPANESLIHGGGVAALIAEGAGEDLVVESREKAPLKTGKSVMTCAGKLNYKGVIHTVGPIWQGGDNNEEELLRQAVLSSLQLSEEKGFNSLAMPVISAGVFKFPFKKAVAIIFNTSLDFYNNNEIKNLKKVSLIVNVKEKADEALNYIIRIMPTELTPPLELK